MSTKTKNLIILLSGIAVFVVAMAIATFYDFSITQSLAVMSDGKYISTSFFAKVLETFGEDILYIMISIACAILFWYVKRKKIKLFCLLDAAVFIIGTLALSYGVLKTCGYLSEHNSMEFVVFNSSTLTYVFYFAIGLVLNIGILFCFFKCDLHTLSILAKWALIILLACALSNLFVQGIKGFFGRLRYRAIYVLGDEGGYTPWYILNGKRVPTAEQLAMGVASDIYKSFPSGHTCAAGASFALVCLPNLFEKFNNKLSKIICYLIPFAYTIIVAFSRLVAGAHYFSDTLVGGGSALICFVFFKWLVLEKGYLKFKRKNKPTSIEQKQ